MAIFEKPQKKETKEMTKKRGLGEGSGTPLQYSFLENPMDGGAWWAAVHGVAKSQTQLSDFTFTFCFQSIFCMVFGISYNVITQDVF